VADDRAPQIEEIKVRPQDGVGPQHQSARDWGITPPRYADPVERYYDAERRGDKQAMDEAYWDRLLEGSGIPEDWIRQMLEKGFTPKEILKLWDTRTPATKGWINLGPDPYDLPVQMPDASFQVNPPEPDAKPIEEVVVREKLYVPPLVVKIFPKPLQIISDAALFGYDLYQTLPANVRQEFEKDIKDAYQSAMRELDEEIISNLRAFLGLDSQPDLGTTTYDYGKDGRVVKRDTPTSTNVDYDFFLPFKRLPLVRPTKPPVPQKIPDPFKPEWFLPDPDPWPEDMPPELPPIKLELPMPTVQPDWKDTPFTRWKTGQKPEVKFKLKGRMRINNKTKVDEGNRLRGPREKKGHGHAAGMFLRGLYKIINRTYGTYDEFMELKEILMDNIGVDKRGNIIVYWEQIGYDLLMRELQDRAIGKMSGLHREMIQQNGWWINPQFGRLPVKYD